MKNLLEALKKANFFVVNEEVIRGIETNCEISPYVGETPLELRAKIIPVKGVNSVNLESLDNEGKFTVASHWSGSPRATCPCARYQMWVNNPHWGESNGKLICHE